MKCRIFLFFYFCYVLAVSVSPPLSSSNDCSNVFDDNIDMTLLTILYVDCNHISGVYFVFIIHVR